MTSAEEIQALLKKGFEEWKARWRERHTRWMHFLKRLRNPAQASYELGRELVAKGLYKEAKYRFRFTLWRQPKRAEAWYNLACCHLAMGEEAQALEALKRCLTLKPADESARYLICSLNPDAYLAQYAPHITPPAQALAEFDARADNYDEEELDEWNYRGHWDMMDAFLTLCGKQQGAHRLLDAGCGTGLLGPLIRPYCAHLTGVDISPAMLAYAAEALNLDDAPCYDALEEAEITKFLLQGEEGRYSVILAANLVNVIGDLRPFMAACYHGLQPGGWLIFSTEQLTDENNGYQFRPQRKRFAHSADYLRQQAEQKGWLPKLLQSVPLYPDVPGWMVALQKPAAG